MIFHVLGWLTVASQIGVGSYVIYYLSTCTRVKWVIPKPAGEIHLSGGADYVGEI